MADDECPFPKEAHMDLPDGSRVHMEFVSASDAQALIVLRRDGTLDLRHNPNIPGPVLAGALEAALERTTRRMSN